MTFCSSKVPLFATLIVYTYVSPDFTELLLLVLLRSKSITGGRIVTDTVSLSVTGVDDEPDFAFTTEVLSIVRFVVVYGAWTFMTISEALEPELSVAV